MSRVPWLVAFSVVLAAALPGRGAPTALARQVPAAWGTAPLVATGGALGGATRDMAIAGHQLWYGTGATVTVADLSVPTQPRVIGRSPQLGDMVSALVVSGNRAYVAAGAAGLVVLDISAPERPRITAVLATAGPALDVALAGGRALVAAEGAGLLAVDVSAPDRPRLLGAFPTAELAARVVTAFNHAYVLTIHRYTVTGYDYYVADQVEVFDLAGAVGGPPTTTFPASDLAGAPEGPLAVAGSSLLVGVGHLTVHSLAKPAKPVQLATLETGTLPRDLAVLPGATQVLVAGGRGHPDSGEVTRVDLTDPSKPAVLATWYGSEAGQPTVAASGDLFCLSQPEGGITVASLAQQPPTQGPVQPAGVLPDLAQVMDVEARAGHLYLAAGLGGFAVAEADAAGNLMVVGRLPVGTGGAVGWYQDVELPAGPADAPPARAYVRSEHGDVASYKLRVLDVTDPARPAELGLMSTQRPYSSLAVGARYAYAGQADGFDVIDVSHPVTMTVGSSVRVDRGVDDLALAGDLLYVASSARLYVFDLKVPEKPRQTGMVTLDGSDKVLAVAEGRAYVGVTLATKMGRLHVVDVSTPSHPVVRSVTSLPGAPVSIHVEGVRVLAGLRAAGTHDVDDQPQVLTLATDAGLWPRVMGGARVAGEPTGLASLGPRAWAATGDAGLTPLKVGALLSLPMLRR
jgi:hypothetical protein